MWITSLAVVRLPKEIAIIYGIYLKYRFFNDLGVIQEIPMPLSLPLQWYHICDKQFQTRETWSFHVINILGKK